MATVKILYNDSADRLERYLKNHLDQAKSEGRHVHETEHSVFLDGVTIDFSQVQSDFNSKGNNALHLIQSWSPDESKLLRPEVIHEMGVEMAKRFAPGHQYVVQTHTDQPHHHNHILINPVHMETGKRIQNKLENVRTLRNINDELARERGLSVLPPQEKLKRPGPNEHAQRIEAYRGRSYIVDLSNKANFARSHATNYDEYLSILNGFNIQARIENENITYFYPGREVGKRGRNLSPQLDKPGLEKKFEQNKDRIQSSPDLQATLAQWKSPVPSKGPTEFSDLVSKRADGVTEPRQFVLNQSVIPLEEVQKAKTKSILEYCRNEKIQITEGDEGRKVLKNREYVEVSDYSWTNHRNKTQGTLIDFVANHRSTSLLHAVSIINNNPNLMLLEKHIGEVTRGYQSFHIPKENSATRADAVLQLAKFFGHSPPRDQYASLFKSQSVQVTSDFKIRFFPEKNTTGYLEYIPDEQGKYQRKVHGEIRSPYLYQKGSSSSDELAIFIEPRTLLKTRPYAFEKNSDAKEGKLALLEPNLALVHQIVATRKNLKKVRVVQSLGDQESPVTSRFFEELRESLDPFSIDTTLAWEGMPTELPTHSRNLNAEPTIGFFYR